MVYNAYTCEFYYTSYYVHVHSILANEGFGLGCGGSLRPGLVLWGGGGGGVGLLPSDASLLLGCLSTSTLPPQLEWLVSILPSMLEVSSRTGLVELTPCDDEKSVATVWLRGFISGGCGGATLGAGPGGLAMVLVWFFFLLLPTALPKVSVSLRIALPLAIFTIPLTL
jgi:hypothetical protein